MKKFIFVIAIVFLGISLSACSHSVKSDVLDNISDIRYNIFMGKNSEVTATVMCGLREAPYAYDGVSNKTTEFGIITVNLKDKNNYENISYILKAGDVEFKGILDENPYDHSFMVDFQKILDCETCLYLTIENLCDNMMLICESANFNVQYTDAIEIALVALENDISKFYQNKKFCAECYLKIIFDSTSESNPYYWYFGIVGQNGEDISVIIDPQTSSVITKSV